MGFNMYSDLCMFFSVFFLAHGVPIVAATPVDLVTAVATPSVSAPLAPAGAVPADTGNGAPATVAPVNPVTIGSNDIAAVPTVNPATPAPLVPATMTSSIPATISAGANNPSNVTGGCQCVPIVQANPVVLPAIPPISSRRKRQAVEVVASTGVPATANPVEVVPAAVGPAVVVPANPSSVGQTVPTASTGVTANTVVQQ